MASPEDVALGRLILARGWLPRETLSAVYAQLPPQRALGEELIARRLLDPARVAALRAELRRGPPGSASGSARLAPPPSASPAPGPSPPGPPASGSGSGSLLGGIGLPQVGEVVAGRYRIEGVLGQGGMGAVFRARDPGGAEVALKVLLPLAEASSSAQERFRREAEAVARVDAHPGIVRVRDFGQDGEGLAYVTMDLVEGQDLGDRLAERGPLPLDEALHLVEQVARAAHHCHEHGVLHRDLKPANVLVRAGDDTPLLTDFGLALDAEAERLSRTGEMLGTPAYMSPEQADGQKHAIDRRTDVYALGAILYELLSGQRAFAGGSVHEILRRIFLEEPPPLRSLRPELPADAEVICSKAMAKEADSRYRSAAALADDLSRLRRGEPIEARPPSRRERLRWRWRRRDPRLIRQLGLALVGGTLLTGVLVALSILVVHDPSGPLRAFLADELPVRLDASDPLAAGPAQELALSLLGRLERAGVEGAPALAGLRARLDRAEHPSAAAAILGEALDRGLPGAGALVAWSEPARRTRAVAQGARLRARLALAAGAIPRGGEGGEARLLSALAGMGWGRPRPEQAGPELWEASAEPRAELQALSREDGPSARAAERVLQALARDEGTLREVLFGSASADESAQRQAIARRLREGWPALPEPALPPLAHLRYARLRGLKPRALLLAGRALGDALPPVEDGAWADGRALEPLVETCRERLLPFFTNANGRHGVPLSGEEPLGRAELRAGTRELLRRATQAAEGRSGDDGLIDRHLALLSLLMPQLGRLDPELVEATKRLVSYGSQRELAATRTIRLEPLLILLQLGLKPPRQLLEGRFGEQLLTTLETHLRDRRSGDAYLLRAEALDCQVPTRAYGLANTRRLAEAYADALGSALAPAERASLGLPPAQELARSLAPRWQPYARWRAAYFVLTHTTLPQQARPERKVYEAALDQLRALRDNGPARFGPALDWLYCVFQLTSGIQGVLRHRATPP